MPAAIKSIQIVSIQRTVTRLKLNNCSLYRPPVMVHYVDLAPKRKIKGKRAVATLPASLSGRSALGARRIDNRLNSQLDNYRDRLDHPE
jgi:hypothetical protein